ncbi:sulfite exporter TauE/SafE family protein [Pseudonocardia sp. GCM10023141]|uniref:sulfite exporter TauE/SafE family protein n=1 Tax=Pseudonocardia sp. GCM10023141 TaxID=3252653 RepID=UPI00361AB0B6
MTLALVPVLAVLVGVTLGLLGGGGSILMVPLLVYVAGVPTGSAITTSLFVVGVTSLAALLPHLRRGTVQWHTGMLFGTAAMAGAFAGGLVGGHLPEPLLLGGFAVMMIATAVAMLRGRRTAPAAVPGRPLVRTLLTGVAVGVVAGLVGAGGGFLVVPALALLGGLAMPAAIGTSLLVIALQSAAGFTGHLGSAALGTAALDWPLTLTVTGAAVLGALIGAHYATRVPATALRRAFGWFVLAMGTFVLLQQLPASALLPAGTAVGALAVAAAGCALISPRCPLRSLGHTSAAGVP